MFMPAKVSHPKQSNSQFVSQSLLSGYAALSELVCSSFTLSLVEQEDPGALVLPPKISAAGNFTFEENHKGDYVLDVAPEPAKKSNRAVKAGKKTLEELQVRHSLLCPLCIPQVPFYVFLSRIFVVWSCTNCGVIGCGTLQR